MASAAQITANRKNARHSTGPRTNAGKQASAANATKHGLSSADPVLPNENRDEYDRLFADYCAQFEPANEHETFLIRQMTHARWRLARIQRLEVQYFDMHLSQDDNPDIGILAGMEKEGSSALDKLQRYAANAERSYYRAHKELTAGRKNTAAEDAQSHSAEVREIDRIINEYVNAPIPPLRIPRPGTGSRKELKL